MTDTIENKPAPKLWRDMARRLTPAAEVKASTSAPDPNAESKPVKPASKASLMLGMLQRADGATISQLVAATDWLPHTTRAALTGLKKKGYHVTSMKAEGEERVYRVVAD
ncbi:DUF3489 domain-containing protein [Parasphingorhabdus sp.]|uniref:DUF3489 domain-containing protein n=1 Tax=Parasphingorhabdus sp. TaxID=2709688 RepID=UPI003001A3BD